MIQLQFSSFRTSSFKVHEKYIHCSIVWEAANCIISSVSDVSWAPQVTTTKQYSHIYTFVLSDDSSTWQSIEVLRLMNKQRRQGQFSRKVQTPLNIYHKWFNEVLHEWWKMYSYLKLDSLVLNTITSFGCWSNFFLFLITLLSFLLTKRILLISCCNWILSRWFMKGKMKKHTIWSKPSHLMSKS